MNSTIAGAPGRQVYLDHAATSRPKPLGVVQAMDNYMREMCTSPGRGGYRLSLDAGRLVFKARAALKRLFNAPSEESVVFTLNVTHALNMAILGLVRPGDHVVTTSVEHNSVIRPLRQMQIEHGIELTIVKCDRRGMLDPADLARAVKPDTRAVVMTHASNVLGSVLPVVEAGRIAHEAGAFFILDTAQTAGVLDIDFADTGADVLAFTGHKSLMGPPGTGGFIAGPQVARLMKPLLTGGTGSRSHLETQPEEMPDKFEAGTMNTVGIAGLGAAVEFVASTGVGNIREHELALAAAFIEGAQAIDGVIVYGPGPHDARVPTVSVGLAGRDLARVAHQLDADYGVMVRPGLHCSPLAHQTAGTFPDGTLRFSFGYFNTRDEVDYALNALATVAMSSDE
jgi:cysteine desulfurase/selenocysteine lyase